MIEDFHPLAHSIEWELSRLYFEQQGGRAFSTKDDHVPFEINNSGNLSRSAAEVFFEGFGAADRAGGSEPRILVLEVGLGSGLFARYFLDAFRGLCVRNSEDYYSRLCYVGTDQSKQMLGDIGQRGLLADHAGHFRLAQLDGLRADTDLGGAITKAGLSGPPFRAVFLNYLLDNLPATVLQVDADKVRQLCVRTCLARGVNLSEHTNLSAEEIARKAASPDPNDKHDLVDLYPLFSLQYDYRQVDVDEIPYGKFAVECARKHQLAYVLHSYGAIQCLEACLNLLHDEGFILLNDYGQTKVEDSAEGYVHQKFSGSIAIGLNFPLLKAYFEQAGYQWVEPAEETGSLYARMLGRNIAPETIEAFHKQFGKAAYEWLHEPEEQARNLLRQGRNEAALWSYREALQRQPNNWCLMGEIAKFLTFTLRDYTAGLEMAKAALEVNPCCSADLWNTFGDSLFCLEQVEEAQRAFQQALEIDPTDVRARFNLAYVCSHRNDQAAALKMIAEGLSLDKRGEYRERLLQKQGEILNRLAHRYQQEARFMADRVSRYLGPPPDGEPAAAQA
jgi:tetratricopeptide (TPR) repeat protein